MFKKKKSKKDVEQVLYSVGIMSKGEMDDDRYEQLSYLFVDAADNVGTTTSFVQEGWDKEQLRILQNRFPELDLGETCFIINEIIPADIQKEIKRLEEKHKWKKFFNNIPLGDYIDAEDRAVLDATKTVFSTNSEDKVEAFLKEKANESLVN